MSTWNLICSILVGFFVITILLAFTLGPLWTIGCFVWAPVFNGSHQVCEQFSPLMH
jgi:hypothetical protein